MEIGGVHVMRAEADEEREHGDLDDHDRGVDARRFADADDEQRGDRQADDHRREIEHAR